MHQLCDSRTNSTGAAQTAPWPVKTDLIAVWYACIRSAATGAAKIRKQQQAARIGFFAIKSRAQPFERRSDGTSILAPDGPPVRSGRADRFLFRTTRRFVYGSLLRGVIGTFHTHGPGSTRSGSLYQSDFLERMDRPDGTRGRRVGGGRQGSESWVKTNRPDLLGSGREVGC